MRQPRADARGQRFRRRRLSITGVLTAYDEAFDIVANQEAQSVCGCGDPIVLFRGTWLHVYNPELTGNDDHDANPGRIIPNPRYRPELDEHYAGDGCAIYDSSAVIERPGTSETAFVSDLEPGDVFRDPTEETWWQVSTVVAIDDEIHVECDEPDGEVAGDPGTAAA